MFMLLLRLGVISSFTYLARFPIEKINSDAAPNLFLILIFAVFFIVPPGYFIWTLSGILMVRISRDKDSINCYFFYKKLHINIADIDSYYTSSIRYKFGSFKGLLLKLKNGACLEITAYNVRSIEKLHALLSSHKIAFKGAHDSRFPLKPKL